MKILVVGTGYVGLVTGACMAEMGHHITCLDINEEKITRLDGGEIPIYEPGLEELVKRNRKAERLTFSSNYSAAIVGATVCFLCVDTPVSHDGSADLSQVAAAAHSIAEALDTPLLVVNKSTVPVGTADFVRTTIAKVLRRRGSSVAFDVVSNPEFLKEGSAVYDCMKPDRVIIGADNSASAATMQELYAPFMLSRDRLIIMDILSAEMTKYAANAMLAARISLMNEFAAICEKTGANIDNVRKGIGSDSRIGYKFIYPGLGFGGSCLPKDLRALLAHAERIGCDASLLHAIESVNSEQKQWLSKKIRSYFVNRGGIAGKSIAILGLSFKPDTDDMREAASLVLIKDLIAAGAILHLFDPVAMEKAQALLCDCPNLHWCNSEYHAAAGADAIALVTEWKQFRFLNLDQLKELMQHPAFFDGRNQYTQEKMDAAGFDYISIGKTPMLNAPEPLKQR